MVVSMSIALLCCSNVPSVVVAILLSEDESCGTVVSGVRDVGAIELEKEPCWSVSVLALCG